MGHISKRKRIRIATAVNVDGRPKAAVARNEKVSRKCVHLWAGRYEAHGHVDSKKGGGRKCEMSHAASEKGFELLMGGTCASATQVAAELFRLKLTNRCLSRTTVMTHVKKHAQSIGRPITASWCKPKKKLTAKNMQQRLEFCLRHRRTDWGQVMFTDRCKFQFRYPGVHVNNFQWRFKGTPREEYKVNKAASLNVYAGITPYGPTRMHVVSGTTDHHPITTYKTKKGTAARNITSAEYESVLSQTLLQDGEELFAKHKVLSWQLQQDNDPTHKKASVKAVSSWNSNPKHVTKVSIIKEWPPHSPDLNLIENCWSIVQRRVDAAGCSTLPEFKSMVLHEFMNLDVQGLYASMKGRIEECIKANGGKTRH